jgi:hypothetical protein
MKQIVIMPGGFHPFHAGHYALYKSALEAFPQADVYVAATNAQKERPFPFSIKEKLAKLAGVQQGRFIQVKSPFKSEEITSHYNPNEDVLIFVRSEKDKTEQPKPGGTKKDGSPAYFQPYTGKNLQPFSKHAYIAYLPTVEFGPGIKSATEIRNAWPNLDDRRKTAMVMSLYPATQKNPKLAQNVVQLLDMGMGGQEGVAEGTTGVSVRKWANQVRKDHGADVKFWNRKEGGGAVDSVVARNSQGETVGVYNRKTGYPTVFEPKQDVAEGWKEKVGAAAIAGAVATSASANTPKVPLDKAIQQATAVYNINKAVKKHKEKEAEKRKSDEKQVKEQDVEESEEALQFATQAHAGQTRAGGEPYVNHPMRVADSIKQYKQSHNLDALINAALLHDTVEDTDTTHEALHDLFGGLVASLVQELTSDPEQIKKMGKKHYLAHKMAAMSSYALVIKLADRLDNVQDITTARTPEWRQKYKNETEHILNYIEKTRALSGTHRIFIDLIRKKIGELDNTESKNIQPQKNVAENTDYLEEK